MRKTDLKGIAVKMREGRGFYALAVFLLVLSVMLHVWKIGAFPAGIHVDESSIAFNALSIAETGKDEYGVSFPVFFRGFDNYHNPVMVYVLAPVMKIFGFEKWALRLPSALFHLAASIAFYFLARLLVRNRWAALAAAFVFSVLPWIFPVSRIVVCGFAAMLLFLSAGWYFLFRAFGEKSRKFAIFAGLMLALSMYSTHSGRPTTALSLVIFVLCFNFSILRRWKIFLAFVLSYVLALVPMIVSVMSNSASMTNRFSDLRVWQDNSGAMDVAGRITERYLEYFGPDFLFISGDPNVTHCTKYSGELYMFLIPFILAGVFVFVRNFRRNPYYRFILLCLLLYPSAAVLTIAHGHSTCCINGTVYWMLAAAVGAVFLWNRFRKYAVLGLSIVLLLAAYEISGYFLTYFGPYAKDCRVVFNTTILEAVEQAKSFLGKNETLYISKYVFYPQEMDPQFKPEFYSLLLFIFKVSPEEYWKRKIPEELVAMYDGKFSRNGVFLTVDRLLVLDAGNRFVEKTDFEKKPPASELISRISTPSGVNFEIYRVRMQENHHD